MKRKPRFTITMDTSLYAEFMNNWRERGSGGRGAETLLLIAGEKMEKIQGQSWLDEICRLRPKLYGITFQQRSDLWKFLLNKGAEEEMTNTQASTRIVLWEGKKNTQGRSVLRSSKALWEKSRMQIPLIIYSLLVTTFVTSQKDQQNRIVTGSFD